MVWVPTFPSEAQDLVETGARVPTFRTKARDSVANRYGGSHVSYRSLGLGCKPWYGFPRFRVKPRTRSKPGQWFPRFVPKPGTRLRTGTEVPTFRTEAQDSVARRGRGSPRPASDAVKNGKEILRYLRALMDYFFPL